MYVTYKSLVVCLAPNIEQAYSARVQLQYLHVLRPQPPARSCRRQSDSSETESKSVIFSVTGEWRRLEAVLIIIVLLVAFY